MPSVRKPFRTATNKVLSVVRLKRECFMYVIVNQIKKNRETNNHKRGKN